MLTPANVNKYSFGRLFNYPIEYQALAQPLYVPGVTIPGKGVHNVVYVATMSDAVYAFDADDNTFANASPLWYVNFTDPNLYGPGIDTARTSTATLPCSATESSGPGFTQEGIVGTPVIDSVGGIMYVVAKTVENNIVRHRLHALDITTGQELLGGPVLITASSISNKGKHTTFNSLHQKNRPGLLLQQPPPTVYPNPIVYMAFGSNSCNDGSSPWVLAYDATSLAQLGSFNASPDKGLASIWQSGSPIAGDADTGNIYVVTAESSAYDVPSGGQSYANSVLKLSPLLQLLDYFTPSNVAFLNQNDLDLSSGGPVLIPDQAGSSFPHMMVAAGKQGTIYLLNRDDLGMYAANDTQILHEYPAATGSMFETPTFWNGQLYYAGTVDHIKAFAVDPNQGQLSLSMSSTQTLAGEHSPSISANGTTNGILWTITGNLWAFDASNLKLLYNSNQNATRDKLPPISHFITQTVVNGKVYIATRSTLEVFGLLHDLVVSSGAGQSAQVLTTLQSPIQIRAQDPYNPVGIPGVTITFSDGGKGGSFNPSSAVSDQGGNVSTTYTFPKTAATYTLTASAQNFANVMFTETATPGPPVKVIAFSGNNQKGPAGTILPLGLVAKAQDAYANGVQGINITFDDLNKGGIFTQINSQSTDANGLTRVNYKLPITPGKYSIKATPSNCCNSASAAFTEASQQNSPANVNITGGNSQTWFAGWQLPQALTVVVVDQYGNPMPGVQVTFNDGGAGGSFGFANPVVTDNTGTATQTYTLPPASGPVNVTATANGVNTPATFTETAQ